MASGRSVRAAMDFFKKEPGELTPEGFRTVLGRASGTTVELRPQNVDVSGGGAIYYIAEQRTEPIRIEATHRGNTFTLKSPIPPEADHVIVVINADGGLSGYGGGRHRKRWLLAHERRGVQLSLHPDWDEKSVIHPSPTAAAT